MDANLEAERQADYQVFEAKGTPYEIGFETARRAGKPLGLISQLTAEQRMFAERCRTVVEEHYPEMSDEFKGYADGAKVPEEEMLWHYTLGVTGGCSGIAVRTPQGMYVGRNYDFFYWENRRHLIATRPSGGFAHIGMHEGLVGGRFDGLNEKGLFVSFNGAGPHPDPAPPGVSFHLLVRYALEKCADAKEARDALMNLPVKEAKSYMVVDQSDAFVVEVHPERRAVRRMEGDALIMTNHFKDASMAKLHGEWPNSAARYRKLEEWRARLTKNSQPEADPMETIQQALAEHEAPLCGHEDGLATFWSCAVHLDDVRISYALGAPCRNDYKEYFRL